jgi:heat shock protein HtpX
VTAGNLFEQQRANRRRSAIIVTLFILFFAWIGFGGDLAFYLATTDADPGSYRHAIPWFGLVAVALALGLTWHARKRGPKEILWSTGAWQLLEPTSLQEKAFVNVVHEMAIASGLPVPTVWIVPDKDPNAFATGTDAAHAHVAVTEGLLEMLDRDELQGVVAHEMAHIKNDDMKLMTLLAALIGVIALISDGAWRTLRYGGRGGRRGSGGRGGGGKGGGGAALAALVLVAWLLTLLIAPLVSRLMALGVSRKREFLADASAAQFTRNPAALASALRKIEDVAAPTKAIRRGAAHLCIADPLGRRVSSKTGFMADLLGTHPPIALRIARLRQMAYERAAETGDAAGAAGD